MGNNRNDVDAGAQAPADAQVDAQEDNNPTPGSGDRVEVVSKYVVVSGQCLVHGRHTLEGGAPVPDGIDTDRLLAKGIIREA